MSRSGKSSLFLLPILAAANDRRTALLWLERRTEFCTVPVCRMVSVAGATVSCIQDDHKCDRLPHVARYLHTLKKSRGQRYIVLVYTSLFQRLSCGWRSGATCGVNVQGTFPVVQIWAFEEGMRSENVRAKLWARMFVRF